MPRPANTSSASLSHACPHGVYMSLTPGDCTLWAGVLSIRSGPYSPSILRFQISFPPSYPAIPPLVTFSSDIFHPLITPLTTYRHSVGGAGDTTSDAERLPPGGFSLRDGFPAWYGKGDGRRGKEYCTFEVLRYIRRAFDDEDVLDKMSVEAAGNTGAWHAWRAHRAAKGEVEESRLSPTEKKPGEWNWDGVWEVRVKKGLEGSLSEAVLYGGAVGDDLIRFLDMQDGDLEGIKEDMLKGLEGQALKRGPRV